MLAARHAVLAATLLLPAAAQAQRPVRTATATLAVTAYVTPVLTIEAIDAVPAMAAVLEASHAAWSNRILVRANVPHRVLVRPANGGTAELRGPDGRWITASASNPLDLSGTLGQATHRVECRGPAAGCALSYELRSTNEQFPMRVTGSLNRASNAAAVSSIATSS